MEKTVNIDVEQRIIHLLKERDQDGIHLLYRHYGALIYGLIYKIVQLEDLAENVMQDTFMKIWQRIETYNASKGKFIGWIIYIARNTAIDAIRSKNFQHHKQTIPVQETLSNHLGYATELNTDYIGIKEVVGKLEAKYADILDLIYFAGFTHAEAAKHLDLPLGTVKSRVRKAIQELRKYFGYDGH